MEYNPLNSEEIVEVLKQVSDSWINKKQKIYRRLQTLIAIFSQKNVIDVTEIAQAIFEKKPEELGSRWRNFRYLLNLALSKYKPPIIFYSDSCNRSFVNKKCFFIKEEDLLKAKNLQKQEDQPFYELAKEMNERMKRIEKKLDQLVSDKKPMLRPRTVKSPTK